MTLDQIITSDPAPARFSGGYIAAARPDDNKPVKFHTNPDGKIIGSIAVPYDSGHSKMLLSYECPGGEDSPTYHHLANLKESMEEGISQRNGHASQIDGFVRDIKHKEQVSGLHKQDIIYADGSHIAAQRLLLSSAYTFAESQFFDHYTHGQPDNNEFGVSKLVKDDKGHVVRGERVRWETSENGHKTPHLMKMTDDELRTAKRKEMTAQANMMTNKPGDASLTNSLNLAVETVVPLETGRPTAEQKAEKLNATLAEFALQMPQITQSVLLAVAEHNLRLTTQKLG
jgi:hypothetical protein